MAVGISRSIGIGMKKCCGGTISGGGGSGGGGGATTFTLSIYEDYYNPTAPPDCDAWEAYIKVNGVTQCTMIKTSNNAATITNPTLTITTGDIVEVEIVANAISNVQCNQAGYNRTDVSLLTGSLATSLTPKLTVSSTNTATYTFNPPAEQNVHDFITIQGTAL
jgi:hypothetical protein